jgi:hypothetical protein
VLTFVALVFALWAGSADRDAILVIGLFVAFGLLIVGMVLLIQNGRRMRSFAQECLTRVGCRKIYVKRGLRAFFAVMGLLWVGGPVWYVVELTRIDPGYTTQPGG